MWVGIVVKCVLDERNYPQIWNFEFLKVIYEEVQDLTQEAF